MKRHYRGHSPNILVHIMISHRLLTIYILNIKLDTNNTIKLFRTRIHYGQIFLRLFDQPVPNSLKLTLNKLIGHWT